MLTVIDESTRECLAIPVARRIGSDDVLHRLAGLFSHRGPQATYDRTTARSSPPRQCETGYPGLA